MPAGHRAAHRRYSPRRRATAGTIRPPRFAPPTDQRSKRPPKTLQRILVFLAVSLAVHLLIWFGAPKQPLLPPKAVAPRIDISVVEKTPPKPPPVKPPPPKPQEKDKEEPKPPPVVKQVKPPPPPLVNPKEITKAYVEHPSNKPSPMAPKTEKVTPGPTKTQERGHASAAGGDPLGRPKTGEARGGSSGQVDPGQVNLFAPDALGMAVRRNEENQPDRGQFMAPGAGDDANSPLAEKARVGARIDGQLDEARTEGDVEGGLRSSCNDGIDQGADGYMDCADPGCRMMPACRNTSEYAKTEGRTIPDDSVVGVSSTIDVPEDGSIRTVSIRVVVKHGSPGDLSLEVEHGGHTMKVRLADRHNRYFPKAYLLKDFIGGESAGPWTLRVRDVFGGASGSLVSWHLYVTR